MKNDREQIFVGIVASPGYEIAHCQLLLEEEPIVVKRVLSEKDIESEVEHFSVVLSDLDHQLRKVLETLDSKDVSYRVILSQLAFIEDPIFRQEIIDRTQKEKLNIDYIFVQVLQNQVSRMSRSEGSFYEQLLQEFSQFSLFVINSLNGRTYSLAWDKECILVARDLSPSQTVRFIKEQVVGFAIDSGSQTSHVAILARSLGFPAVVGLKNMSMTVQKDSLLIIDGCEGKVIINPTEETLSLYWNLKRRYENYQNRLSDLKEQKSETLDHRKIHLMANVGFPEEIDTVHKMGASGVGLFRTEFLYMNRVNLPTEKEHYEVYKKMLLNLKPLPFYIRTLDIGGDKFTSSINVPKEISSFLGLRAIRLCLKYRDIFTTQLRAIARASALGSISVIFPMISNVDEMNEIEVLWNQVCEEVQSEGIQVGHIKKGVMIETPSSALIADKLLNYADFFSIGTNDLIQYTLAVERGNESIAHLYQPFHPAVLKLLKMVVVEAHRRKVPVHVCGEMAGDPLGALLLIGLGVFHLSMSPVHLLRIKDIVRRVRWQDLHEISQKLIDEEGALGVKNRLKQILLDEKSNDIIKGENYE